MSSPPTDSDDHIPLVQKHFIAGGRFTAGLQVTYQPSSIVGVNTWQHLATGQEIGNRFHSFKTPNQTPDRHLLKIGIL